MLRTIWQFLQRHQTQMFLRSYMLHIIIILAIIILFFINSAIAGMILVLWIVGTILWEMG